MISIQNIISVSELRKNTLEVFEKADKSNEPIAVLSHSQPVAVVMSLEHYAQMQMQRESEPNL